ncbi:MAG TPA: NADP-dependent oxidoreductase [Rhabdochlamydiaceae bacterium]|nr:NADP-dependent oxidoreductase [Rhabdochlamydiaceae bacterium]
MKAAYIEIFAPEGNVKVGQIPTPEPGDGEVCIAVSYAGVNPADAKIAQGLFQSRMPHQFPLILGWEASGTVHSMGKHAASLNKGDKVYLYCRKPIAQWGSWAEYLIFPAEHIAVMPKNLSMAQAAAVPLAGLTAWQALFEKANLKSGEQILIHGGGGGVGGFAIQWAKCCGAKVLTTASSSKFEYVKSLHADEIIDYRKTNFVDQIRKSHPSGIDVVFDTIGGSVYKQSFEVLKPGGRIVSTLEQPDADLATRFKVRAEFLFVQPNGKQLREIAELFELGKAKPPKIQEFSLDQASQALNEINKGHTTGKIVLKVQNA